jgi:hypothetical protein
MEYCIRPSYQDAACGEACGRTLRSAGKEGPEAGRLRQDLARQERQRQRHGQRNSVEEGGHVASPYSNWLDGGRRGD